MKHFQSPSAQLKFTQYQLESLLMEKTVQLVEADPNERVFQKDCDLYFKLDNIWKLNELPYGSEDNEKFVEFSFYHGTLKNKIKWKLVN